MRWTAHLLLLLCAPAQAVQQRVTPAQLCAMSDAVLFGRVSDMETLWAATPEGGLERHAFFEVKESLRGPAMPMADVVLPGGSYGHLTHWVEDVPELQIDGWYVLFLQKAEFGWEIIGGDQGAVPIAPNDLGAGYTRREVSAWLGGCNVR
jgi:hypothetical protein